MAADGSGDIPEELLAAAMATAGGTDDMVIVDEDETAVAVDVAQILPSQHRGGGGNVGSPGAAV